MPLTINPASLRSTHAAIILSAADGDIHTLVLIGLRDTYPDGQKISQEHCQYIKPGLYL